MAEFVYNNTYNASICKFFFMGNLEYNPQMSWKKAPDPKLRAKVTLDNI